MKRYGILAVLMLLGMICFYYPMHGAALTTLQEAQEYAAQFPEYVKPDTNDWLRTDFSSFHRAHRPGAVRRIASWLGMNYPFWDARKFKSLLKGLVSSREREGFQGEFAEQYRPKKGDAFIIWGDLFGAFHSLVRDLTYLHEQGIINNRFKIIKPNYRFVFNGNVIDGSPYVLETLTLVLRLLAANHSRVFYIRGYHEAKERWHNFELENELKIRARHVSSREAIPLNDLLVSFFDTLPSALYVTHEEPKELQAVLIANNQEEIDKFGGVNASQVLIGNTEKRGFFRLSEQQQQEKKKVKIKAYITSEDRLVSYHKTEGLSVLSSTGGVTTWMVFSSPTERSQRLYQFQYDAFARMIAYNGMDSWTISLFKQRVGAFDGFQESDIYKITSGWQIKKDGVVEQKRLHIGSTMDLSKGASPIGKRVKEGLELAFDKEHTLNTVPGIVPELATKDDEYTPIKTRSVIEKMIKSGVNTFIGSQGSPSLESYLDLISDGKVLVLFPFTGSPIFRKPDLKYLIHYRGSYIREGEELINYALKDLKSKKIAVFYQDDAFGRGALEGARRALKAAGITKFLEIPHERNVVDYKSQAAKIRDFNPDTILFSSNTPAIRGLIRQMGVQYFAGKHLLGLSVYEDAFERFLKDKGLSFTLIRMVPDPKTSDLPIAKEYRAWADKLNMSYDKVSFEQFINANILFEILRSIEGPVTNEKIIEKAESMKNYPFKGLVLHFNPETRELSENLWIDPGTGEWILKGIKKEMAVSETTPRIKQSITEGPFKVATLTDFTKGTKQLGRAVQAGIQLRFGQKDTVARTLLEILFVDDQYTPAITRAEVERLLKKGFHTFLMPTGSPTLKSYIDLIREGKVLVLFPLSGAPIFRTPKFKYLIHLRGSYDEEGKALATYAVDKVSVHKLLLFYQDDSFGKGLLEAATAVLKTKKDIAWKEISYKRDEVNFYKQVRDIEMYDPDSIMFFSTATAAKSLIRQLGIDFLHSKKLFGCSDLGEKLFLDFVRDMNLKLIYVSVVPNPETSTLEIVQQFREAAKQKGVLLDPLSLESYIATDLFLYVLGEIKGRPTNEKIIAYLEAIKDLDYKGLKLDFYPDERTLLHSIWLDVGEPEWEQIWVN